ncbi:MAG: hypothetical protein HFH46_03995 [Bacilli bacterium]|nr:hypothetical protein [Bacilli bacterium]MCI9585039.1 hypothetical protein [Bacilli bacterium]
MKKILLIIIIFTLTGCTSEIKLDGKITEIKYNDTKILKNDYNEIKKMLNIKFKNGNEQTPNNLTIKTTKDIYYFKISDTHLQYNNKYAKNNKLNKYLNELKSKYYNTKFYDIKYEKIFDKDKNNININLDKTSNYIIITFKDTIKDFKINEIEYKNKKYKDIDLLYEKDIIDGQTVIIRKSININKPDIRISFSNQYNYNVSIIPAYKDEEIKFEKTYQMKNSD